MNKLQNLINLNNGEENREKVKKDILSNISFRGSNLWILACAIFIASIGLNVNSTAVIIGAMLISPLMGPIVGSGFALATYDFDLLKRSAKNLIIATFVGLIVSSLYFYLSPFKEIQSELLARTSPTIYDVMIAFIGGTVGAISITRVEKGNPIPGVAIATALMPPLCTAGFGLATFNIKFIAGALYLYSINCFFIGISTFLVIKYLKYSPVKTANPAFDKKIKIIITILMLLLVIPSFYLAYGLLQEKKYSENVDKYLQEEFIKKGYTIIYKQIDYSSNPKVIQLAFLAKKFDSIEINQLNNELSDFGLKNTKLLIKQNTIDLKNEILSEINKSNSNISEKDLQIQTLASDIDQYKMGNTNLDKEIKIIFPEINNIYFGVMSDFAIKDSIKQEKVIIYSAEEPVDETKLKNWMETKFNNTNILVLKK